SGTYERHRVIRWKWTRLEAHASGPGVVHSVETKTPPIGAREIKADQVPAVPQRHETMRLDVARGALAVLGGVREAQSLLVATGLRDDRERAGVDARRPAPGGWPERHIADRVDASARPGGQRARRRARSDASAGARAAGACASWYWPSLSFSPGARWPSRGAAGTARVSRRLAP